MKICDNHRAQLRLALSMQGLGHLVAQTGEELQNRGSAAPCPLNIAESLLIANCVEHNPHFALAAHSLCPFCRGAPQEWIQLAAANMADGPFKNQVRIGHA